MSTPPQPPPGWHYLPPQPPQPPPPYPPYGYYPPPPPKRIDMSRGGWLTYYRYTLILTAIGGIFAFLTADDHHSSFAEIVVGMAIGAAFTVVPIMVYRKIDQRHPEALEWVKWLELGTIGVFVLCIIGDDTGNIGSFIGYILKAGLWLAYFHKSERVRLTFGRNLWPGRRQAWNYPNGA